MKLATTKAYGRICFECYKRLIAPPHPYDAKDKESSWRKAFESERISYGKCNHCQQK